MKYKYTVNDIKHFVQPGPGKTYKGFGKYFSSKREANNHVSKTLRKMNGGYLLKKGNFIKINR
jgi:hypothetical protein